MRRTFWILFTPALLVIVLGSLFNQIVAPGLIQLAVQKIEEITKKQGPFQVKITQAQLTYWPLGVRLNSVQLKPKVQFQPLISDIEVQEVSAHLALFALLTGKLKISEVNIQSPSVQINYKWKNETPANSNLPLDLDWQKYLKPLELLPIEQLNIYNLNLKIFDPLSRRSFSLSPVEVQFLKLPNLFQAQINAPQITTSWDPQQFVKTELQFSLVVTPDNFRIRNFALKNRTLEFNLSGQLKKGKKKNDLQTQMYWNSQISLDEIKGALKLISADISIPELKGLLTSEGSWKPTPNDLWKSDFQIKTQNVQIEKFKVGNAEIKGQFQNEQIEFDKIEAQHPAGLIELTGTQLGLTDQFPLTTTVKVKSLDYEKLFQSLNLKNIPVFGQLQGQADCKATLKNITANCKFEVATNNFQIQFPKRELLKIKELSGRGELNVDLEKIDFKSELFMPQSSGKAEGRVTFSKGFNISYLANQLNWSDVENLSGLNLLGVSQITGTTEGNASQAVFNLTAKTKSTSISDFYLGDTDLKIDYKDGNLFLPQSQIQLQSSVIKGAIKVDLNDSRIQGKLNSQNIDLGSIKEILLIPVPIPIEVAGKGQLDLEFEGPLNFWKLNTKLQAQFVQPQLAGEVLESLRATITSTDGNFQIQQLEMLRNESQFVLNGNIDSEKNLNLIGNLKNVRLEESDNLSRIGWPLSGQLNSQIKILGSLSKINLTINGQIARMILNENEVPNSNFKFQLVDSKATLEGLFFGNKIQTLAEWPVSSISQKVALKFKSLEWDYTPWLSLFNAGAINEETQGQLTSDIQLESVTGDWTQLSGFAKLDQLSLTRQGLTLSNKKPIEIQVQNGLFNTQNFLLNDQSQGRLEIRSTDSSFKNLDLQILAQTDLKLMQIFVPTFDEISGPIELNTSLKGPVTKPNLIGQMKVTDAYLKVKGFPHSVEKLNLDSSFSQSRVLFNKITAELGGGRLTGEGSLQIQGNEDIPLYIRASGKQLTLNIPNGVKTKGDVEITLSGRKFPYLLNIQYQVKSADVEMEFGGEANSENVRKNYYLPTQLKEVTTEPIELDIKLTFEKPVQIKNNLLDAQVTGPLSVKGSPSNPILIGQIKSLKGSQLFFKDKPFEIQTANIQFNNNREINPELFIAAQTRVDTFDVSLLVQGTAKEPTIRLSSVPPLSDNDLTSLLALGVTSSQLADVKSSDQQTQTANEVFAAAFQSTGLSQKVQSATGFNVQLSNSFDTTRNISVPKFTVSRKLNKKTSASVAFPVTGDQKTPEGKIQYSLTDAFSINGSYETRKFDQSTTNSEQREIPSILGLDLEFSREFK